MVFGNWISKQINVNRQTTSNETWSFICKSWRFQALCCTRWYT